MCLLKFLSSRPKRQSWTWLLASCLALFLSVSSHALKIGEITVNSVVGERFFAVVPLDDISRSQATNILVSLAPRSVYQRLGVDFEYFHTSFIFDVLIDDRDRVYLRVVSKDVVFEPYIDFVVSLRWPGGFQSRQFTALLDMPLQAAPPKPAPSQIVAPQQPETVASPVSEPLLPLPSQTPKDNSEVVRSGSSASLESSANVVVTPLPADNTKPVEEEIEPSRPVQAEPVAVALEADKPPETLPDVDNATTIPFAAEEVLESEVVESTELEGAEAESAFKEANPAIEIEERSTVAEEFAAVEAAEDYVASDVSGLSEEAEQLEEEFVVEEREAVAATGTDVESESATEGQLDEPSPPVRQSDVDATDVEPPEQPVSDEAGGDNVQPVQVEEAQSHAGTQNPSQPEPLSWRANSIRGDTLWALARQIHAQSGGRLIDIVNALHKNNQHAFIRGDANLLRVGQRLSLSASQLYAQTPEKYRGDLQHYAEVSGDTEVAREQAEADVMAKQDGVLSLVARDSSDSAQVSDLTASLSQEAAEAGESVSGQIQRASEQVESVETRMDELIEAYQSLAAKTDQLKAIEDSLDEVAADSALPVLPDQPELSDPEPATDAVADTSSSWFSWLLFVIAILIIGVAAYWLSTLLKARRIQQHKDWIERDWDDELFDGDMPLDEDVGGVVELRGESAFVEQQSRIEYGGALQEGLIDDAPNEGAAELQASLYIAYERYAEAEKLIKENLERDPTDTTLKSLLLEVYAATEQEDAFEALAAELMEADAANFEKKVSALRN